MIEVVTELDSFDFGEIIKSDNLWQRYTEEEQFAELTSDLDSLIVQQIRQNVRIGIDSDKEFDHAISPWQNFSEETLSFFGGETLSPEQRSNQEAVRNVVYNFLEWALEFYNFLQWASND
jgi:hypothetical protein